MTFIRHLIWFPRVWINLTLTLTAGCLQGLGLAFFIPVINQMSTDSSGNSGKLLTLIKGTVDFIGLTYSQNVLLLMVACLIGTSLILTFCQQYLLYQSMMSYVSNRRERLLSNFLDASWPYLAGQSSGETVNKLLNESDRAAGGMVQLVMATTEAVMIVVFLTFGLMMSWELLVATILMGAFGFLILLPVRRQAVEAGRRQVTTERQYMFQTVDYLSGVKLIKALGSQRQALDMVNGLQSRLCAAVMTKIVSLSGTEMVSQMIPLLALTGIVYVGTAWLELETTTILIFVVYLVRMAPLMSRFQQRHQSYLLEVPTIEAIEESIQQLADNRESGLSSEQKFEHLTDRVTFENVIYRFPSADGATLKNISFDVPKGSMIAFVGGSGGGKSTILELLSGLRRPTSGSIVVDGVNLNDLNITSWRKRIGYVGQYTIVFNDTLKRNLLFAHPDAHPETIDAALRISHLQEVINGLPEGLETILGEGGVRFSGGQRQRMALARALIGQPEILILDEATSALDTDSERLIQNAIDTLSRTISVVVVAHRLSTIRNADIVHVIEFGQIVESGTYGELLAKGGRLGDLHNFQMGLD